MVFESSMLLRVVRSSVPWTGKVVPSHKKYSYPDGVTSSCLGPIDCSEPEG